MKKLTFKVSSQKDGSFISLIKEVDKISCRISIDFENGFVSVENVNDIMIDSVIELVNNYYTIVGVDIVNTLENSTENPIAAIATKSISDVPSNTVETDETVIEAGPTILEPQTEDDLIIKKFEFQNEYLERLINKYVRTISWVMFKMNISEKEVADYIYTAMNEISMRYNKKRCIDFSIGDVVDCSYGVHLPGEINGGHVSAIVCNISRDSMVYLVPITKAQTNIVSHSYLTFNAPKDVVYENDYYKGGTALLDKGKYVRAERFNAVIGKTTPAFFEKILRKLANTFDFTKEFAERVEEERELPLTTTDEVVANSFTTEKTSTETVGESDDTTINKAEQSPNPAKKYNVEDTLQEVIGFAFDKLDPSKNVEDQVENFLTDIGMVSNEKMITQSFVIACDIKKIKYDNVIFKLHEVFPEMNEETIKNTLKETFKYWLEKYPTLAEKCPKISIMAILKLFAKKFA